MSKHLSPARVAALVAVLVPLLTLGAVTNWWTALALATALLLLLLGYQFARLLLYADHVQLRAQRQALDAEWRALEQTRRARAVFLAARRAMQDEARNAQSSGTETGSGT